MRYAVIMAGGSGTRLWPVSVQGEPKQLVRFIPGPDGVPRSLLHIAADRLEGLVPGAQRLICTGEVHRGRIKEGIPGITDDQIIGEPTPRDTVNAVGLSAAILEKQDPDAVFAVLTADHLIEPEETFRARMELGYRLVEEDPNRLVTFAIEPTFPATGFGYVKRGNAIDGTDVLAFEVERFVEKPNEAKAKGYVESGEYGWNSGMFVWKASTVMRALETFKPEIARGLRTIQEAWGTDTQAEVLERVFPTLEKISVDFALMEPATDTDQRGNLQVCTVTMDLDWLDVGSWPSFGETLDADADGNAHTGGAIAMDSSGTLTVNRSENHTVCLLGCEDLIVIHTDRATLVMPRSKAQDLKNLHGSLPEGLK
ncbi:MAG: mannose-1-phosphate guanylyltransferase [Phycisphaerales bacterium]